jgi:hypothetical protein
MMTDMLFAILLVWGVIIYVAVVVCFVVGPLVEWVAARYDLKAFGVVMLGMHVSMLVAIPVPVAIWALGGFA